MATRLPASTFDLPSGAFLSVEDFDPGTLLPTSSVKVRLDSVSVYVSRPFSIHATEPAGFVERVKAGITVLEQALAALEGRHEVPADNTFAVGLPTSSGSSSNNLQ